MSKDVKEIHDIPNIEHYLNCEMQLDWYIKGDNTQIYSVELTDHLKINIEVISGENELVTGVKILDLITQTNIEYLSLSYNYNYGVMVKKYCYRPLVKESEKSY